MATRPLAPVRIHFSVSRSCSGDHVVVEAELVVAGQLFLPQLGDDARGEVGRRHVVNHARARWACVERDEQVEAEVLVFLDRLHHAELGRLDAEQEGRRGQVEAADDGEVQRHVVADDAPAPGLSPCWACRRS